MKKRFRFEWITHIYASSEYEANKIIETWINHNPDDFMREVKITKQENSKK